MDVYFAVERCAESRRQLASLPRVSTVPFKLEENRPELEREVGTSGPTTTKLMYQQSRLSLGTEKSPGTQDSVVGVDQEDQCLKMLTWTIKYENSID